MSEKPFGLLLTLVIGLSQFVCEPLSAQDIIRLEFRSNEQLGGSFPYFWDAGGQCGGMQGTNPAGPFDDCGSGFFAEFTEFQDAVVGPWSYTKSDGASIHFTVLPFDFPEVTLLFPKPTSVFHSGQPIEVDYVSEAGELAGLATSLNPSELLFSYVDLPSVFTFTLRPGIQQATAGVAADVRVDGENLIVGPTGATDQIELTSVRIRNNSPFVDFLFVLGGDVNQDATVNLLDIGPFVDLLNTGGFMEEADMNRDGVVSLEDVNQFVDAITGE